MMHEFRLPSLTDPSLPQKKPLEKTIPPNVSNLHAAIFKKTITSSTHNKDRSLDLYEHH
jgi:hypothetical protein